MALFGKGGKLALEPKPTPKSNRRRPVISQRRGLPSGPNVSRLALLRLVRVDLVPQAMMNPHIESEIYVDVGKVLIYRDDSTPEGSREGAGTVRPVEFVICVGEDDRRILADTAPSLGKAMDVAQWFASRAGLRLIDEPVLPY